jgi:anthranilate phosphoribosyltransferase
MQEHLNKVMSKKHLTKAEISALLNGVISGELNSLQTAALLSALRTKGETVEEITTLIEVMRKHMITIPGVRGAIDTCGTGGDGAGTFNISTTVAFVVAGAGVPVVKHGNRAASSTCGSADVLEALGVMIMLKPEQAQEVLKNVGLVFLFAPLYHPAMKNIAPIRKELGVRTVFNFLGPFLNPAGVKRQLIGVPSPALAKKLASVAARLGYEHLIIVSSTTGMDEIAVSRPTKMYEVKGKVVKIKAIDPQKLGFKKSPLKALQGGSAEENAQRIHTILAGEKGACRDVVVLNSAYALHVAGKAVTIAQGIKLAEQSIDSGAAKHILEQLIQETKQYAQ